MKNMTESSNTTVKPQYNGWTRSDEYQFYKETDGRYHFLEVTAFPDGTQVLSSMMFELKDYMDSDPNFSETYLSSYGYDSIEAVVELYGADSNHVMAECVSETDAYQEGTNTECSSGAELVRILAEKYGIIIEDPCCEG